MADHVDMQCWRCGAIIDESMFPLRRGDVCAACNADLHVCKQCRLYNATISDGCDEPLAGGVSRKDRGNYCDYFAPSARAFKGNTSAAGDSRAALDALFGEASPPSTTEADDNRSELERLFGIDKT